MFRHLQCALLLVFCGCAVEPGALPGVYTILTDWAGGILAINGDGTHEMAFLQVDDGTVERVKGTWEYRKIDIPFAWELLLRGGFMDPLKTFGDLKTSGGVTDATMMDGVPAIGVHPDLDIAWKQLPPALWPKPNPRGRMLLESGDTAETREGNYVAAMDDGIDVLRLGKDFRCFRDRLCYPSRGEIHWEGQWSPSGGNEITLGKAAVVSSLGVRPEECESPPLATFTGTYDNSGVYLRESGGKRVFFKLTKRRKEDNERELREMQEIRDRLRTTGRYPYFRRSQDGTLEIVREPREPGNPGTLPIFRDDAAGPADAAVSEEQP